MVYLYFSSIFRVLKPFIRRDFKMAPLKLKMFRELYQKVRPGEEFERHPVRKISRKTHIVNCYIT